MGGEDNGGPLSVYMYMHVCVRDALPLLCGTDLFMPSPV